MSESEESHISKRKIKIPLWEDIKNIKSDLWINLPKCKSSEIEVDIKTIQK